MHTGDFFCFLHHLTFRNPQINLDNGHSEAIDLNTVELPNGNLNGVEVCGIAQMQKHRLLFQAAQGMVGFRQEVARALGRIYKDAVFDTNRKSLLRHISAEKGMK